MNFIISNFARLPTGGRAALLTVLAAILCAQAHVAFSQTTPPVAPARDPAIELRNIKQASILDNEPADAKAVQAVCTRCHSSVQFLGTPRSPRRWTQVYAQMTEYGASPTDDQIDGIIRYFARNLTVVNVNTSPAGELAPTLQVDVEVARAIVARRMEKRFSGPAELATFPGVDKVTVAKLGDRLQF
jgi:hypothetical protein